MLQKTSKKLTETLRQRSIPGAITLACQSTGAQQVVSWIACVGDCSLEAVALRPTGQNLSHTVLYMPRLCAVHNWGEKKKDYEKNDYFE